MKLRKAIFVTVLVAIMLAVIDICFYVLFNTGFAVLTGAVVVYGFLRGAVDFCRWLCKPDPAPKHLASPKKQAPIEPDEPGEVYDWAKDEEMGESVQSDPEKTAAMMRVLDEDF